MEGYLTKLDWPGGPNHGWWVELLKEGVRVAYMSLEAAGCVMAITVLAVRLR
jgi:hypothetical protein